jgi:hypothetical protein
VRALVLPSVAAGLLAAFACAPPDIVTNAPGYDSGYDSAALDDGGMTGVDAPTDANASSCHPGSGEFFMPGKYRPATGLYQNKCTAEGMVAYYRACLGPSATTAKCAAQRDADAAAGAACVDCIITPDTAPYYGPIVQHMEVAQENVAGCIELLDPGNTKCASNVQQSVACDVAACSANCPVKDQATFADYSNCVTQADTSVCGMYSKAADCVYAEADGGPASRCLQGTFEAFYDLVVPIFCATPQTVIDSGAPSLDGG